MKSGQTDIKNQLIAITQKVLVNGAHCQGRNKK